jgi:hypothetical protein
MGLLKKVNDALIALNNVEHRFDPFFRPFVDTIVREPIARVTQALINARRKRETLQIAQEQELPGEAALVTGIIDDMAAYMRASYNQGSTSARATRRRTASSAANSPFATTFRPRCAAASSRHRRPSAPGCVSPVRGLPVLRTSMTSVC